MVLQNNKVHQWYVAAGRNKILITTQLLMSLSDEFFTVSSPTLIRNMEIVKQGGN